jgi:hypothetical protein
MQSFGDTVSMRVVRGAIDCREASVTKMGPQRLYIKPRSDGIDDLQNVTGTYSRYLLG